MKATAKDLRFHPRELLESVARGEQVIITYRGKACAKLIPLQKKKRRKECTELFGIWKDHEAIKNVKKYLRKIRQGRT